MSEPYLLRERRGAVMLWTMSRPETRNTLGAVGDGEEFEAAAAEVAADETIRVVVLTGAGDSFCAGGDVKSMREGGFGSDAKAVAARYRTTIHRAIRALWRLETPAVAAVNGAALGLGLDVACYCDVRVASRDAALGSPFLALGLLPGDGGAWLLPRIVGMARASEMFYTARRVSPEEALSWGLVNEVVAPGEVLPRAMELAETMARQPSGVLRGTKRLIRQGLDMTFDGALESVAAWQAVVQTSSEHREAVEAFFAAREKRKSGS